MAQTPKPPQLPGARPFAVGDVVYLRSGSPRLTVISIVPNVAYVEVAWIVYESGELRKATLPEAAFEENK